MTGLRHRATQDEIMDGADVAPAVFAHVLSDIARINTVTLARRPTRAFVERAARGGGTLRILDVGFGHGDMLRHLASHARRRGIACTLTGIDINPRSEAIARAATDPALGIDYRTGDYRDLAGEPWDVILSNMVAHHMTHAELIDFMRFMHVHARTGWFVNDLHRHRVAHLGYPLLARAMRCHPIVRADGRLSIARGFRAREWRALLAEAGVPGTIEHRAPFRLCVAHRR